MGTAERRNAILKFLCRHRHETVQNLASEFGVSERTIRRDIEVLSYTEPIYTQPGRYGGGVYVVDGYSIDRMYMTTEELSVIQKLIDAAEKQTVCIISAHELQVIKKVIVIYTKPKRTE